jgi:hypothetical protein
MDTGYVVLVVIAFLFWLYQSTPKMEGDWKDDSGSVYFVRNGAITGENCTGQVSSLPFYHIRVMWQTPPEGHGRGWRGRLKNGRVVVWDEDVPLEPEFATRDGRRRWRRQGL